MLRILRVMVFVLTSVPVSAQDAMQSLDQAYESLAWQGVGKLSIGGHGMCTAVLIAPDLVLTAAHCLFSDRREIFPPDQFEFRAGERFGSAEATRDVRQAIAHPEYAHNPNAPAVVPNDIGILRLSAPIHNGNIQPFETGGGVRMGEDLTVVSFAHDRTLALSLQNGCEVFAQDDGAIAVTCDVDFGSSGAPVFRLVGGEPILVAIVSAKAEINGERRALAATLDGPLEYLLAEINRGQSNGARRVTIGSDGSGAARHTVGD